MRFLTILALPWFFPVRSSSPAKAFLARRRSSKSSPRRSSSPRVPPPTPRETSTSPTSPTIASWRWSVDGKLTTFLEPCGRSNGLCFDAKGNLIACADEQNQLWSIDPAGKVTVLVKDYQGSSSRSQRRLAASDQGLYFTDPYYKRSYWKARPQRNRHPGVYYLSPDRKTLVLVRRRITSNPTHSSGTPDGKDSFTSP